MKDMSLTLGDVLLDTAEGKYFPVNVCRKCKVCDRDAKYFLSLDFSHNSVKAPLKQYGVAVHHYRCEFCKHIFTDFCDDWEGEEYSRYIYNEFYIKVDPEFDGTRSKYIANIINKKSSDLFKTASVLDYGSGQGYLEKYLLEYGFKDVVSWDPYSGGEWPSRKFDIVFGFEVLEHSSNPYDFFANILNFMAEDGACYCSQSFIPENIEVIRDRWAYFGPRNGHISFFAHESIIEIAARLELNYKICEGGFFFWRKNISPKIAGFIDNFQSVYGDIVLEGAPFIEGLPGWNALEKSPNSKFRWSGSASCPLGVLNLRAYKNTISLAVFMAISEDHFNGVSLLINDIRVPLRREGNRLVGEFVAKSLGKHFVTLETAPPLRPKDIGNSQDGRHLGLAIRAIESTPDWCL